MRTPVIVSPSNAPICGTSSIIEVHGDDVEHLDVQPHLRVEMLVENGFGDTGGRRDVVHRGGLETLLGEHPRGELQQLCTTLCARHLAVDGVDMETCLRIRGRAGEGDDWVAR